MLRKLKISRTTKTIEDTSFKLGYQKGFRDAEPTILERVNNDFQKLNNKVITLEAELEEARKNQIIENLDELLIDVVVSQTENESTKLDIKSYKHYTNNIIEKIHDNVSPYAPKNGVHRIKVQRSAWSKE